MLTYHFQTFCTPPTFIIGGMPNNVTLSVAIPGVNPNNRPQIAPLLAVAVATFVFYQVPDFHILLTTLKQRLLHQPSLPAVCQTT
tara:strand:- start:173 stop:427 length:255 start_codon:yes stop_codon:yes gene_type:complete